MAKYVDVVVRGRSWSALGALPATVKRSGLRGLTADGELVPARHEIRLQRVGCNMYKSALPKRTRDAIATRRARRFGTRLCLEQSARAADPGPWELLCDGALSPPEHLAVNILTPVIRRLVSRRPNTHGPFAPIEHALQIVVVAVSPGDGTYEQLNLRQEERGLNRALRLLIDRKAINVTWIRGKDTVGQLTAHLNRGTCHVLHFIGHGVVNTQGGGSVVFEDQHGSPNLVSATALAALLSDHDVRLVLLNCCRGALARPGRTQPSMAAILAQHFPAVIGMQAALSDKAAIRFSSAFYEAIAHGRPVEVAVAQARLALSVMGGPHGRAEYIEWATPVLFLSVSQDVFKLQTLVAATAPVKRKTRRARLRKVIDAIPEIGGPKEPPPEDPQKFKWGEQATRNGRTLSATVKVLDTNWYRITLTVAGTRSKPLTGSVTFHLHDTFDEPVRRVAAREGKATLTLMAWGAFTVGAACDGGKTKLELDLAELRGVPKSFRES